MAIVAQSDVIELPGNRELPRFRWTREQYHKLFRDGFVSLRERCELIAGEIILKCPLERGYVECCRATFDLLGKVGGAGRAGLGWSVAVSDYDEPRPDIIVLSRPSGEFVRYPGPEDVLLVVEVTIASPNFACGAKSQLYARAQVPEYWILDVNARRLIVRRDPSPEGYQTSVTLDHKDRVWPLAAPGNNLFVADMLPPLITR